MSDLNRLLFIAAEEHVFPFDLGLKPLHGRGHTAFHVAGGKEQGEGQERRLQQVSRFYLPRSCPPASLYYVPNKVSEFPLCFVFYRQL